MLMKITEDVFKSKGIPYVQKYPYGEPFNVASGTPTTVTELVETITDIYGYEPVFNYDITKPVMIPKRQIDINNITKLGWKAKHSLKDGLKITIKWYEENKSRWKTTGIYTTEADERL